MDDWDRVLARCTYGGPSHKLLRLGVMNCIVGTIVLLGHSV
jgi:hypothetical protein